MSQPTRRMLVVFETVCRTGSAKAAAAELGITQAGVRESLTRLYQRLGVDSAGQAAWVLWGPGAASRTEHLDKSPVSDVLHGV